MKFAKYLQDEVVPEWRKAYINYKQGKKLLKAIETAIDVLETKAIAQQAVVKELDHHLQVEQLQENNDERQDGAPSVRLTIDPSRVNSLGSSSRSPFTAEPENIATSPERPAPIYIPDSPTGTTPIISSGRGHGRNYSAIEIPPLETITTALTKEQIPRGGALGITEEDDDQSDHASTIRAQNIQQQHDDRFRDSSRRPAMNPDLKRRSRDMTSPAPLERRQSIVQQFGNTARSHGNHLIQIFYYRK